MAWIWKKLTPRRKEMRKAEDRRTSAPFVARIFDDGVGNIPAAITVSEPLLAL